jgi:hypothetical protein
MEDPADGHASGANVSIGAGFPEPAISLKKLTGDQSHE